MNKQKCLLTYRTTNPNHFGVFGLYNDYKDAADVPSNTIEWLKKYVELLFNDGTQLDMSSLKLKS